MRTVTARAPGRVNLIGEHLDYNGGLCLPVALPLATTTTVSTSGGPDHVLRTDAPVAGWEPYVLGLLEELGVTEPLQVSVTSTVPVGAGLSSSAALTCSTALAVDALLGLGLPRDELATACVRAENDHVGAPTGGMDQAVALFASAGAALLIDFASGTRTHVPFDPAGAGLALLVVDIRVSHQLSDGSYADRSAACRQAADELGIEHLAHASYADLPRISTDVLRRRARHVVTEQHRVLELVAAVHHGRWDDVGALMTASHLSLRDDFEVSCSELDLVTSVALAAGALGARMTGGGFGGSAVVLTRQDEVPRISALLTDAFTRNGLDAPTCFQVEASGAAAVLG